MKKKKPQTVRMCLIEMQAICTGKPSGPAPVTDKEKLLMVNRIVTKILKKFPITKPVEIPCQ